MPPLSEEQEGWMDVASNRAPSSLPFAVVSRSFPATHLIFIGQGTYSLCIMIIVIILSILLSLSPPTRCQ
jgi:hypothetical protein